MHIHLHNSKSNTPRTCRRQDIGTILVGAEKICGMPRETEQNNIR